MSYFVSQVRITHDADGQVHVQHVGAEHVVEGSTQYFDVPAGTTVIVRHITPTD